MVAPGTVFTAENFKDMAQLAETYGNGKLICTSRLAVEIPGIPFEKIDEAVAFAASHGLSFGGTWGKRTRMGTPLSRLVKEEEVLPILEKTLLWFKENAQPKERLGLAIDRLGVAALEEALFSDAILNRKETILDKG